MAETTDNLTNTSPHGKKEATKSSTTLESLVNESSELFKSTINLGLAGLIPLTQATLLPVYARDTAILAGTQVLADATTDFRRGKKYTSGSVLESSIIGTAVTFPLHQAFELVHKIPLDTASGYIAKSAAWGGLSIQVL